MGLSKLVAGVTGATMVAGLSLMAMPAVAAAAPVTGHGVNVPAQHYKNNPDKYDWLGSYMVDGKQVWCVRFALNAPDSDTAYQKGQELKDKWGIALKDDDAANISYLLLRYGNTASNDEAAALAHLLHSYTSGTTDPKKLDEANDFAHIGYNVAMHLDALPAAAKAAVDRLTADAKANHGPWTAGVTAPKGPQTIGTADKWTVQVTNSAGKGVTGVPVKLTVTDATVASTTVTTPADGSPLVLDVTPTGPNPSVTINLDSPLPRPLAQAPVTNGDKTQWIVSTGGESALTGTAKTTAVTAPGQVKVTKTDAKTNAAIAGVSLRLTGPDKTAPAVKQDGSKLTGQDGKPLVLTTGADGTATVPDLRTPQDVCLVEVSAPSGYDQGFNASSPPSVCGTIKPGEVLALTLSNTPNTPTIPVKIPAGGQPLVTSAAVVTQIDSGALVGFGALVLLGLSTIGLLWRRRVASGR